MRIIKCERCGVDVETKALNTKYCHNCKKVRAKEQSKKFVKINYEKKQKAKKENHKCVICGCLIEDKIMSAKYCYSCKMEVKKQWKRDSYKRNIETSMKYLAKNKEKIKAYSREKEQERRDNLSDRYVKKLLIEKNGWKGIYIPQSIIETKLIIIKTKRLCKQLQN